MSAIPPVRPDLQLAEGYHSPQVEAEVRLNTNESPFPPPDEWRAELQAEILSRLADAPAPPADARIVTSGLSNDTLLRWSACKERRKPRLDSWRQRT